MEVGREFIAGWCAGKSREIIYFTQTHFVWSKASNRPREVITLVVLLI